MADLFDNPMGLMGFELVEFASPKPDKNLQRRVGLIVRVNQHTATLDCGGQKWRVAFELLRHLVDV